MTVLQLQIMLHYHALTKDFPDMDGEAQSKAIDHFVLGGMLERTKTAPPPDTVGTAYMITSKGRFFVEALKCVPEPTTRFVIPWDKMRSHPAEQEYKS